MVCLGNICRSPLAEGILKSKLNANFEVDSAGTAAYHVGNPPDKEALQWHNNLALTSANNVPASLKRMISTVSILFL